MGLLVFFFRDSWGNDGKIQNPCSFQAIASIKNGLLLSSLCQFFPRKFTIPVCWARYLLEQGSERVTQGVEREVSPANVNLLLFSCLVSTKVTWKIQFLLLTMCTHNGPLVTLEVQNRDVEVGWTNPKNCGLYYSTVGLVPGETMRVEKRILASCLTFWLSHSPRDGAAVCADLECTASHSTICAPRVAAPCGYQMGYTSTFVCLENLRQTWINSRDSKENLFGVMSAVPG